MASNLSIELATSTHYGAIWDIFHLVVQNGDTYVYSPDTTEEEALKIWCNPAVTTYVAILDSKVVGTYVMRPNYPGLGSHIVNCGYMVHPSSRVRGIGRAMAQHSFDIARSLGYIAMQYNFVVSSNVNAVHLWKALGFNIIGTVPKAFNHRELGFVDAYIMYKPLD
jgi:ribosomal protein S18 acetylase RimI-like enzyme